MLELLTPSERMIIDQIHATARDIVMSFSVEDRLNILRGAFLAVTKAMDEDNKARIMNATAMALGYYNLIESIENEEKETHDPS